LSTLILFTCSSTISPPLTSLFFFLMTRPPPRSPLFPYTTLFRSSSCTSTIESSRPPIPSSRPSTGRDERGVSPIWRALLRHVGRSEEHTSELQSLTNLVCRLLLEKKKKDKPSTHTHPQEIEISAA